MKRRGDALECETSKRAKTDECSITDIRTYHIGDHICPIRVSGYRRYIDCDTFNEEHLEAACKAFCAGELCPPPPPHPFRHDHDGTEDWTEKSGVREVLSDGLPLICLQSVLTWEERVTLDEEDGGLVHGDIIQFTPERPHDRFFYHAETDRLVHSVGEYGLGDPTLFSDLPLNCFSEKFDFHEPRGWNIDMHMIEKNSLVAKLITEYDDLADDIYYDKNDGLLKFPLDKCFVVIDTLDECAFIQDTLPGADFFLGSDHDGATEEVDEYVDKLRAQARRTIRCRHLRVCFWVLMLFPLLSRELVEMIATFVTDTCAPYSYIKSE